MLARRQILTLSAATALAAMPLAGWAQQSPEPKAPPNRGDATAYIHFDLGIDGDTMRALLQGVVAMREKGFNNVCLMINSGGGLVSSAIAMYHELIGMPLNLTTYGLSDVGSAAIILFLAGNQRIASSGTRFSFHSGRRKFNGSLDYTPADIHEALDILEEDNARMADVFVERMKITKQDAMSMLGSEIVSVRAERALQMGLVTKIDELHIGRGDSVFYVPPPAEKK